MKGLKQRATRFLRREEGSYSVEALLMFPIMIWAYLGMFIFFDAYRQQNVNLKASYTIGDMLSREMRVIDQTYLDGLNKVLDYLTYSNHDTYIRVTVVIFDEDMDRHNLVWSRGTRTKPNLSEADMRQHLSPVIPIMADNSTAIVVETWAVYEPVANVGIPATSFENVVVVSPRFADQLRFLGINDGNGNTHDDGTDTTGAI